MSYYHGTMYLLLTAAVSTMPEDTRAAFALDALFRVVLWIWEVLAKWLDLVHLPLRQSPAPRAEPSHQVLKRTSEVAAIPPEDGKPPEALLDQSCADFAAAIRSRLSRGDVLAKSLYRQYYSSASLTDFPLPLDLSAAAEELTARILGLASLEPPLVFAGSDPTPPAPGATEKYVLRCTGGEEIEMVAMPAPGKDGAWSLCISSQVGCRMGCTFCETGKMGLLRNLTTGEIVAQVALAASTLGLRVGNIIFMGMGEPLDNVVAVIQAIKVLTDPHGLGVPLSHVTISTSGEAHHVPLLLKELPAIRIAFSLHAANDTLRSQLMPINRRVGLRASHRARIGRLPTSYLLRPTSCLLPPTSCLLPPASYLLPPTSCILPPTSYLLLPQPHNVPRSPICGQCTH